MSNIPNKLDANQTIRLAFDPTTGALKTSAISGGFVSGSYDKVETTYVASGNGLGEVATVVYSLGGTIIATLTMAYNASNQLISVTKT